MHCVRHSAGWYGRKLFSLKKQKEGSEGRRFEVWDLLDPGGFCGWLECESRKREYETNEK
jgi:hypothetical protein